MDNPNCEWIRGRLPLCVGVGDGLGDSDDDGGDLGVEDRRAIERHLAKCAGCRGRRSALARALEALAVTAGSPPIAPDATSVWPALERRIASHRPQSGGPDSIWATLDDTRPLRSIWMQDTLSEVAGAVGLGAWSGWSTMAGRGRPGSSPRILGGSWRVVGVSLAASVLAFLVVAPVAWRLRAVAEAKMLADAAPVPLLVGPPVPTGVERADIDAPAPEEDRGIAARQLAQAEPIKPPPDPSPADPGRPGASARLGYDLEHGTPMPPDGRDARPVY